MPEKSDVVHVTSLIRNKKPIASILLAIYIKRGPQYMRDLRLNTTRIIFCSMKSYSFILGAGLGAALLCNWPSGSMALAETIKPSQKLSKLQSAKPILCQTTSTQFFSDGSTVVTEREVKRTIVNRKLKGKNTLAFEYTYLPTGFNKSQTVPSPRYDFVSQQPDGTIVTLAHEYGYKTSTQTREDKKLDEHTLIYLPGQLSINKTWLGDSATILDVDQLKTTVTGMDMMDGEPTWIITQEKINSSPSPIRGIKSLEIVYNLNPRTLSTAWIFSHGSGTTPKTDGVTPKDYKFIYHARCK
jgi:hypothetical protein